MFIDTSAFYAMADDDDKNHKKAEDTYKNLLKKNVLFVSTDHIIAETATLIRRRLGYAKSIDYLKLVEEGQGVELFTIINPGKEHFQKAKDIFRTRKDIKFSFVDALSIAVMNNIGISRYFAYDSHFANELQVVSAMI